MPLFTPGNLEDFLRRPNVNTASAIQAEKVAAGWLQSATGLTEWPDPLPADLYGWALELGGAIYDNPTSLKELTVDGITRGFGGERLKQIIDAATRRPGGGNTPRYSFPAPAAIWGETEYVTQ